MKRHEETRGDKRRHGGICGDINHENRCGDMRRHKET